MEQQFVRPVDPDREKLFNINWGRRVTPFNNLAFSQPKPDGSLRWLIDRSPQNWFLEDLPCQMEGAQEIARDVWMTAMDLKKFHWTLHCTSQRTSSFWDSKVTQQCEMTVLAMGVKPAAQRSTECTRAIASKLRGFGVQRLTHVDEFMQWNKGRCMSYHV